MTVGNAMYDAIGARFEEFTDSASQRSVETETFFSMVGDVRGKSVLDLACGYGFFGRELYRRGAKAVVGVDISPSMIQLARDESARNGESIEYHVRNVAEMETLGQFGPITAAWLFNYAQPPAELEKMFAVAARNLRPGGRLVAYTVEPDYRLALGNFTTYGVTVKNEQPHLGGYRCDAEFVTHPPSAFTFYRWGRDVYERAIQRAGFSEWHWQKPIISQQSRSRYPADYWEQFERNCLQTGLVCTR